MPLQFSNFYKLDTVCSVAITGSFNPSWNGSYVPIHSGGGVYKQPHGGGSNLSIKPLNIKPGVVEEGSSVRIDDIATLKSLNNLIYIVISSRYPIAYVGISERGLHQGIFGRGRFIQHLRKLLVSCDGATNHTGGWLQHAYRRYLDNALLKSSGVSDQDFLKNVLSDIYIAIGGCGNDAWEPKKVEGTVFDAAISAMTGFSSNVEGMNSKTGGLGRDPIAVALPSNLSQIAAASEWVES